MADQVPENKMPQDRDAYRVAIDSEITRVTGKRSGQTGRRSDEVAITERTADDMQRGIADEVERIARKPSANLRSDQLPIAGHVPNGITSAKTVSRERKPDAQYSEDK